MYKTLSAPLVAQVEISSRCPNQCLHCYNYWRTANETPSCSDLSLENTEQIMAQLAINHVFHIVLTGGEPLLNKPVLFRALELATKTGITAGVNSSVVTLTKEDAERFKALHVSAVLTSLMGPTAEVHDAIAQRHGAFTRTLRGIRLLQTAGVPVDVNMVISQKNKGVVRETARLVKSLGLHHFNSTRAGCPGNCSDFSEFSLDLEEFREYLATLHSTGEEENLAVGVLESYPLCGIKEVDKYRAFMGRRCLAGITSHTVGYDGAIRPCSHLDVSCGNLLLEELATIWKRMVMWRDGSLLPKLCHSCKVLPWCGGGCRMEAKMCNGFLNTPDPYMAPQDIEYVFNQLTQQNSEHKSETIMPPQAKVSPRLRMRPESFGGIAFLGQRFSCYLNKDAYMLLGGLDREKWYDAVDLTERFAGGKGRTFLGDLLAKGVLMPQLS